MDDLITQALTILDVEYNPVVVQLAGKTNLSWVKLQDSLLTFESILKQMSSTINYGQPNANVVTNKPRNNFGVTQ